MTAPRSGLLFAVALLLPAWPALPARGGEAVRAAAPVQVQGQGHVQAQGQSDFSRSMNRGIDALDAGDLAAAAAAFREALALRPGHPEAQTLLGTTLLEQGDVTDALEPLSAAARALPDHYPARLGLARAYLALGREEDAIPELDAAVRIAPGDPGTRARLASLLLRAGRLDAAAGHARELARLAPDNPAAQSLLGAIELRRERYERALAAFDDALAIRPRDVDARYGRAAALHGLGRGQRALEIVNEIVELEPNRVDAWTLKADIAAARDDLESKLDAVASYRRALELAPGDRRLVVSLTDLFLDAGLEREAIDLLEGTPATRTDPALALRLGRQLFRQQRLDAARSVYERATEIGGGAEAWYRLGVVLVNLAELEEAERAYRRALELDPLHGAALRELGDVLLDRGRDPEAAQVLERATTSLAGDAQTWYLAGLAATRTGDPQAAVVRYRRALELDADHDDALYNLGLALRAVGDAEGAQDALTRAQAARRRTGEPPPTATERGEAAVRVGYIRYRIGSLEEAVAALEIAAELLPEREGPWFYLGLARADLGRTAAAAEALERAVEIRADRVESWEILARLYEAAGRTEEARRAAARAEELRRSTGR